MAVPRKAKLDKPGGVVGKHILLLHEYSAVSGCCSCVMHYIMMFNYLM